MLLYLGGGQVKDCLLNSNQTLQITGGVIWHGQFPTVSQLYLNKIYEIQLQYGMNYPRSVHRG